MADAMALLERRNEIIEEMQAIRSMRKGSVNEQYLKVCRKGKKDPSLCGPYWVYTRKEKGKTISQRLARGEAEKIKKDVEAFHRFQELCRVYADVSEELSVLEDGNRSVGQKKTAEVAIEKDAEVKRFLDAAAAQADLDFEAFEFGLRAAVLSAGARLLESLLTRVGRGRRTNPVICSCGENMESRGLREKSIRTILGEIIFSRSSYDCPGFGMTRFPGDEDLDIAGTGFSPGVQKLMARAGSRSTFKESRDDLKIYAEISVDAKDVERIAEGVGREIERWEKKRRDTAMTAPLPLPIRKDIPVMYVSYDGTGVPMVPWEVVGRKGKQADGSARTREVKLGCVFTQTKTDDQGHPIRDDESTSFTGAIEGAEEFGWRIYGEARNRGIDRAVIVVVLGDGAVWVWNIAETHFHGAVQIVDLYHARQHLYELCRIVGNGDDKIRNRCQIQWLTSLDEGKVEMITTRAKAQLPKSGKRREAGLKEIAYFETNTERMRYAEFREKGFFVGSGVVEAGCRNVVGTRLKRSGMEWTVKGADAIIALRAASLSNRIEDFWEERRA